LAKVVSGPAAWNSLESDLYHLTDTTTIKNDLWVYFLSMFIRYFCTALQDVAHSGELQIPYRIVLYWSILVVVWHSDYRLGNINKVTLHQTPLVLGRMTIGQAFHIST